MRFVPLIALVVLLAFAFAIAAYSQSQSQTPAHQPLPLKPGQPTTTTNQRLILKDGSYQVVRRYEIVGDRVRYISVERGGDWEELPVELVDWEATRKWERDHAADQTVEAVSPAMKEAAELDKEEADERADEQARRPEVAKGLQLPDEDSVFALDRFEGNPELVELLPVDLALNVKDRHGISTLNPLAGAKASLELEGQHAKVHLHVSAPTIYLSLGVTGNAEQVLTHALTIDTSNAKEVANRKRGAHSPDSGFAIVRADERQAVRIVGAIHVSPRGTVTQDENVISATVEVLNGKYWLKITPNQPLAPGEYALVEILSASDINQTVWDFRVDPASEDNPGSLGPIFKTGTRD
jgi:hypothetical protein